MWIEIPVALTYLGVLVMTAPLEPHGYEPTAEDKLWLLRSVSAEGEPKLMVARTLVNLYVYSRERNGYHGSLTDLVRAYSQPVNPNWYAQGEKHLERLRHLDGQAADKERELAFLREHVASAKTEFDYHTSLAVRNALSSPWRMDWTDFSAPGHIANHYERRTNDKPHENTFWTRAPGWTGYTVRAGRLVALP